jgi:Zn-dependent protease
LFNIDPLAFLFSLAGLAIGLTVHESSHALVANWLGDSTARDQGRISLNPLHHLDPMGTLMMVVSSIMGVGIGWAKPVPVSPWKLRFGGKTGGALVSVAGPVANMLLAALCYVAYQQSFAAGLLDTYAWLADLLGVVLIVNVALCFFNLIPLPPLDGFGVLLGLLPDRLAFGLAKVGQYGPALLLLLVFFGGSLLGKYFAFGRGVTLSAFSFVFGGLG